VRPTQPLGLRERKKQQTREALSWAALRLAVEHGLGSVTVDDIAAAADVSPRTFNNYFSSKYEAIVWRHVDRFSRMAGLLRERPTAEPLWTAIGAAVETRFGPSESVPDPEWTAGVQLLMAEPELRGELVRAGVVAERELAVAVAERTGTDATHEMYPRLVAAAVGAAIHVASEQWVRAAPPVPLAPLVRDALQQFASGLPVPR
jgi:AcrR family transcriptional regulator